MPGPAAAPAVRGASRPVDLRGISYNQPTLVKIYTRTGDAGDTSLFDGTRVSKADPRVDAYGEVDELNAWLGLVRAPVGWRSTSRRGAEDRRALQHIQRDLFAVGAQLADPSDRSSHAPRRRSSPTRRSSGSRR